MGWSASRVSAAEDLGSGLEILVGRALFDPMPRVWQHGVAIGKTAMAAGQPNLNRLGPAARFDLYAQNRGPICEPQRNGAERDDRQDGSADSQAPDGTHLIYLLRHGQTEFNVQGRYQGHSDSPLTELGRRQAEAYGLLLARHLTTPEIWASPLPRAAETARLIARALPGARLTAEPRLKEVSLGQWDGLTRAEIAVDWPEARRGHPPRQWMFHAPGGDRLGPLLARLEAVLQDAGRQGNVVLVSHGIVGRLMRGLHGGLPLEQALVLEAPQDVIYRLGPGGEIAELPRIEL